MTPQQQHRHLVESTEDKTREEIVAILAPLPEEQVKYQYEQRLYEHRLGPTPSTIELRTQSDGVCQSN